MARFAMPLVIAVASLALGPGAASAQPVACGQTITRDTTLHADLGPCPGDGLVIGADNVSLDLNGHSITGPSQGPPYVGVKNEGHDGAVVENGVIRGFFISVSVVGDHNRVGGVTSGEEEGVKIRGSYNVLTRNDLVSTFEVEVVGFRNRVTHNDFTTANGGVLVTGRGNLVAGNSTRFGELGVQVSGPGNVIRENVLRGGDDVGLEVRECRNVRVEGNLLPRNEMRLAGCTNAAAVGNAVRRSVSRGIVLDGGSGNTLARNTVSQTIGSGISVIGGSVDTVVRGNLAIRAGRSLYGTDPSSDGIHVEDPGTAIANNTANNNADYGIQAVPGAIDGGGNTASGNGNPLQCLNVVCN